MKSPSKQKQMLPHLLETQNVFCESALGRARPAFCLNGLMMISLALMHPKKKPEWVPATFNDCESF